MIITSVLFETDRLSQDHIECEPRFNSCHSLNAVLYALRCWNIKGRICIICLLLVNWAKEHWYLEDN